jgi:hypothetical protein
LTIANCELKAQNEWRLVNSAESVQAKCVSVYNDAVEQPEGKRQPAELAGPPGSQGGGESPHSKEDESPQSTVNGRSSGD